MKKVIANLVVVILLFMSTFANAQKAINKQSNSDQTLLAKLKTEQAESGLAVLVDLTTGKVMAKSSFVKKGNDYVPDSSLFNQRIEPGALIMPMSAAMIMDNFNVSLNDSVDLEGGKTIINGRVIVDAEQHGRRFANLKTIIGESSNVWIAKMVHNSFNANNFKLHFEDNINDYVGSTNYILNEAVENSRLPFQAIGYGLLLTPNQILNFYTRVANADNSLFKKPTTLLQVQNALKEVCENGTAKRLFAGSKYSFAGKTSTSLVAGKNGYGNAQFQAAFIGYSSASNPKYICFVMIKCKPHAANHFGAAVAGPVFKAIMENALNENTSTALEVDAKKKVFAPDSIQIMLNKNMKFYHHLEDSVSAIRQVAFEKDSNYKEPLKTFVIDGKEYTGYDGGLLGYYMGECWKKAQGIIQKYTQVDRVAGCGSMIDNKTNEPIYYYQCEKYVTTKEKTFDGLPMKKSETFMVWFYDK